MLKMSNETHGSYFKEMRLSFIDLIKQEIVYDDEVDSWMFMKSPWPISSILVIYLLFVLKVGPMIMKKRKPLNLKMVMLFYNIIQTIFNGYMVLLFFITPGAISYHFKYLCNPLPRNANVFLMHELNKASWYFFISKVIDLLDTVFFVLRKKQSQVTSLHVYHHVNMAITCWAYLKFIKGEQLLFGGLLNSFIHVIMYSYYFLSALGPHMQKYLWWKKYLTRMQIVQFLIIMTYEAGLYVFDCKFPKLFVMYVIADLTLFLYLFIMFYIKTYNQRPQLKEHIQFVMVIAYFISLYIYDCTFSKVFMMYLILDCVLFLYLFVKFYIKTYKKKQKSVKFN